MHRLYGSLPDALLHAHHYVDGSFQKYRFVGIVRVCQNMYAVMKPARVVSDTSANVRESSPVLEGNKTLSGFRRSPTVTWPIRGSLKKALVR